MKNIKLLTGLLLLTFLVSCSSTPENIDDTKTNIVGTWENTKGNSKFEFHSDGRGYTSDDPLIWEVTGPGKFTVTMFIPNLGKKQFNYQFTSMEEFEHESGSNRFEKKNSVDFKE